MTNFGDANCHSLYCINKLVVKNLPNLLWIKKAFGLLDNECSLLSVESKRCEAAAEELANDGLW